jgi:uncharacterized protein
MHIIHIKYVHGSKFDPDKDADNIVKHGLSLVEGEGVLNDPLGLTVQDDLSAGESRWITVGMNAGGEILVVVWTERDERERLISVRRATAKERKDYES